MAAAGLEAPPCPDEMNLPQSNSVGHCSDCHGILSDAAPANLPTLRGRVGWFMCTPEARSCLMRLPDVARSRTTDNQDLAALLNFMVFGHGGASVPIGAKPFTVTEVERERQYPYDSASLIKTRSDVVDRVIKQCGAPASLRLMYPGQQHK